VTIQKKNWLKFSIAPPTPADCWSCHQPFLPKMLCMTPSTTRRSASTIWSTLASFWILSGVLIAANCGNHTGLLVRSDLETHSPWWLVGRFFECTEGYRILELTRINNQMDGEIFIDVLEKGSHINTTFNSSQGWGGLYWIRSKLYPYYRLRTQTHADYGKQKLLS
jgi:hypothetical protein